MRHVPVESPVLYTDCGVIRDCRTSQFVKQVSFTPDLLAVAQTTDATTVLDAAVGGTLARVILEAYRQRHDSTPALLR